MINVESKLPMYEVDGEKMKLLEMPKMTVKSHWNDNDMVVIEVGERSYTVVKKDLAAAIENATNINRF